jgi:disulfide bond formation protein DsbB
MKAYGIGLIILLIAFAISIYPAYISYNILANPPTSQTMQARYDELETASLLGLVINVMAIIGILIFLVEFMKHEHPSRQVSSTMALPPP